MKLLKTVNIKDTFIRNMESFIFIEKNRVVRRVYGGSNYTLAVYRVKNKTTFEYIGDAHACTSGHKGEASEAWSVVYNSLSKRKQNEIKRIDAMPENKNLSLRNYYSWNYTPQLLNIQLKQL